MKRKELVELADRAIAERPELKIEIQNEIMDADDRVDDGAVASVEYEQAAERIRNLK